MRGPNPGLSRENIPSRTSGPFQAGEQFLERVRDHDGAPLVFLVSGGGSSLAAVARPGIEPWDKADASVLLLRSGLDIKQMNIVRKAMSALKGGRLAAAAPHSRWFVFALSDVVDDDLSTIASGPCVQDHTRPGLARQICRSVGLWSALPPRVRQALERDTPAVSLSGIDVHSQIVAGARTLVSAVEALSPWPATALAPIDESVASLARRYSAWATDRIGTGPALLVAAGEPTLQVHGHGRGGRAQHLALLMAQELRGLDATFLAAGTDGRDGPTEHAGAVIDGATAESAGHRLGEAIANDDSATLHAALGTALPRREAVTHLGELHLLLVH